MRTLRAEILTAFADEAEITGNTNLGDFGGSATQARAIFIEARPAE